MGKGRGATRHDTREQTEDGSAASPATIRRHDFKPPPAAQTQAGDDRPEALALHKRRVYRAGYVEEEINVVGQVRIRKDRNLDGCTGLAGLDDAQLRTGRAKVVNAL